ncbi:MAG: hypothetical protein WDN07_05490 [Actinomycetota bacterium]
MKDVQWVLDGAAAPVVIPVDVKIAAAAIGFEQGLNNGFKIASLLKRLRRR